MEIIGWVRVGDKTSCGGTVTEGSVVEISEGRGYTFQGAKVACRKNCVISDGYVRSSLSNGHYRVIHGQKTSGGCPLESTLNDLDGVGNDGGAHVPVSFTEHEGEWIEAKYDEQFLLKDHDGNIYPGMPYTIRLPSGELIRGMTDDEGRTERCTTKAAQKVELFLGHIEE